jgi:dihydropteroate synthase
MQSQALLKGPLGEIPITQPVVMGILNITPDSFFGGSRFTAVTDILKTAERMLADGALILDIGGQSSRPGSERIGPEEEWQRVFPALEAIKKEFPEAWVSIDTYHAEVAQKAIHLGADIINDISFGEDDEAMFDALSNQNITYIGMHKIGNPKTMQNHADYEDVTETVLQYLNQRIAKAQEADIQNIWIDPGFGFAKTAKQNFELLRHLDRISSVFPNLLVGISRKSMIYKSLNIAAEEALNGTSFLHAEALRNGAKILRVHDVKPAVECIQLWQYLNGDKG